MKTIRCDTIWDELWAAAGTSYHVFHRVDGPELADEQRQMVKTGNWLRIGGLYRREVVRYLYVADDLVEIYDSRLRRMASVVHDDETRKHFFYTVVATITAYLLIDERPLPQAAFSVLIAFVQKKAGHSKFFHWREKKE